ncbi:MAG TPA: parallel beta-helix domain-containing protein, partial [Chitinophagales bacterium]|nr:parallel beta-helix domain-containing protein [Chitinophagales bacterium]
MKKYFLLFPIALLSGCLRSVNYEYIEKELQTRLILAQDGDTIRIGEGHFRFNSSLTLDARKKMVIKGAGRDKTVLSFKEQQEGAEGIKITNCENITLEDFTIQDTKGDCIKVQKTKRLLFKNLRAEWTGKPKETNGSYGFYPVDCDSVMIESCIAVGASDAGIYVGQSRDVVIRNCEAYHNVAGIEVENCIRADVYHNYAHHNTGGILIFDMPELTQSGHTVRVFDNTVWRNNYRNFAPEGNIVHEVPPGTGVMILATDNVEVFNNRIINNKTIGTAIMSYKMVKKPHKDPNFDPYPKTISVHDNYYR